jgi:o-succinylbenzoate synthase
MRITRCNIFRYDLPLTAPLLIKGHTVQRRVGWILKLEEMSGACGWGEAAPLLGMSSETSDEALAQLWRLRSSLVGATISIDQLSDVDEVQFLSGNKLTPSVHWAVEQALWNLYAAASGTPLQQLLCDYSGRALSINGLLTGSADDILRSASSMAKQGFKAVKLKVGRRELRDDIDLVIRLKQILGDTISLRLDANRAWDWATALQFSRAVADCSIEYIEEPLADPTQLSAFLQAAPLPLALDETLSETQFEDLEQYAGITAMVLKPSLIGGFNRSMKLARMALEIGAKPVFSSLFESGLTINTLAQITVASTSEDIATGLDTYRWLQEDILQTPLAMEGGRLAVPETTEIKLNKHKLQEVLYE